MTETQADAGAQQFAWRREPQRTASMARLRVVAVIGAIALSAIAALGVTGAGLLQLPLEFQGMTRLAVRAAGVLAALVGMLWLRAERLGDTSSARGHHPTAASLSTAATIMVTLALVSFLLAGIHARETDVEPGTPPPPSANSDPGTARERPGGAEATGGGAFGRSGSDPSTGGRSGSGGERTAAPESEQRSASALLRRILLLLLVLAAAAYSVWYFRRAAITLPGTVPARAPVSAQDAEAGLLASLAEVEREGDEVRKQITAAYHILLAALADAGAPRLPYEAPYEHLHRVLGPLGVPAAPMHTLARLHVISEFSVHDIDDAHREDAARALEMSLDSLRSASSTQLEAAHVSEEA